MNDELITKEAAAAIAKQHSRADEIKLHQGEVSTENVRSAQHTALLIETAIRALPVKEGWRPSKDELYYLKSILRQLNQLRNTLPESAPWIGIGALADNMDWLDCFIAKHSKSETANEG